MGLLAEIRVANRFESVQRPVDTDDFVGELFGSLAVEGVGFEPSDAFGALLPEGLFGRRQDIAGLGRNLVYLPGLDEELLEFQFFAVDRDRLGDRRADGRARVG